MGGSEKKYPSPSTLPPPPPRHLHSPCPVGLRVLRKDTHIYMVLVCLYLKEARVKCNKWKNFVLLFLLRSLFAALRYLTTPCHIQSLCLPQTTPSEQHPKVLYKKKKKKRRAESLVVNHIYTNKCLHNCRDVLWHRAGNGTKGNSRIMC